MIHKHQASRYNHKNQVCVLSPSGHFQKELRDFLDSELPSGWSTAEAFGDEELDTDELLLLGYHASSGVSNHISSAVST